MKTFAIIFPLDTVTATKGGEYAYIRGYSYDDTPDTEDVASLLKVPRAMYLSIIEDFLDNVGRYHDTINSFAGSASGWVENVRETGETSDLFVGGYLDKKDEWMATTEPYVVFETTDTSEYSVEVEHG